MEKANWVKISPPIKAMSQNQGEVIVNGLGPGGLRLESDTLQNLDDLISIEISGREKKHLSGKFHKSKEEMQFRISEVSRNDFLDLTHALRKNQHIELCRNENVEHTVLTNGLEHYLLEPCAIPEFDLADVDTSASIFGKKFNYPFLITGMTGGIDKAREINSRLARVACQFGIPMGVGSQRLAIENPEHEKIFKLKNEFPDLFLMANVGMGQLQSADYLDICRKACDMIEADALAIHINLLQELVQVEGDRSFARTLEHIAELRSRLPVPIYVKEVGSGLDLSTAKKLAQLGIETVDVGGAGGTSWTKIEGMRSNDIRTARLASCLQSFGKSTAECIVDIHREKMNLNLIATGGLRNGHDVALALSIGAKFCGIGLPFFKAALESDAALEEEVLFFAESLKIVMLASGARAVEQLQGKVKSRKEYWN